MAKACSDKAGWLQHSQHAPGHVCVRTGQAGTKKQLCQYCQNGKNKHFLVEVSLQLIFLLNTFPSVCRLCRQTNLFSCKYVCTFPQHVHCNNWKLDILLLIPCNHSGGCGRRGVEAVRRVNRLLSVRSPVRSAWVGWPLNSNLSWIKFTVLLGLIKWIPLADEHGYRAPGLAPLPAGSVFSQYCAALQHNTCWSNLGTQMFQLHSIREA